MEKMLTTEAQPVDRPEPREALPPLMNGDHLDQQTFHERYEAMPENTRAELIGGIVFMPSPLKQPHGHMHLRLGKWVADYTDATPGTDAFDYATAILGPDSEPQPDLALVILSEKLGQTREEDEYMVGAPELIVEVAASSVAIDLHRKRKDYERAGVKEYVVVALRPKQVIWFAAEGGSFVERQPGPDGVLRSRVFPGLWLDAAALLQDNRKRVAEVLQEGLATPEHAAFVAALQTGSAGGGGADGNTGASGRGEL